tara:strand:- start:3206 stop:3472 length:267 start_codon:yes stop_codon:yes gene_type:complete
MDNPVLDYPDEIQILWRNVGFSLEPKVPKYAVFEGQHRADIQLVKAESGGTRPFEIGIRCQVGETVTTGNVDLCTVVPKCLHMRSREF